MKDIELKYQQNRVVLSKEGTPIGEINCSSTSEARRAIMLLDNIFKTDLLSDNSKDDKDL